jgi:hypothetical protein
MNQSKIGKNLCEEHFPEPILFGVADGQFVCKKCIPEYIAKQNQSNGGTALTHQQKMNNARMLGMGSHVLNPYSTEKTLISKSITRLTNFKSTFRYLNDEILEREKASQNYLRELPPLMNSLFDQLDELVDEAENRF